MTHDTYGTTFSIFTVSITPQPLSILSIFEQFCQLKAGHQRRDLRPFRAFKQCLNSVKQIVSAACLELQKVSHFDLDPFQIWQTDAN